MPKKKPPLKGLFALHNELQDASHQVVMNASAMYGAITAHCDMMEQAGMPNLVVGLRKVADKYYREMLAAKDQLYRL